MKTRELLSGKTKRVYDAFQQSDFVGMTIHELKKMTCLTENDIITAITADHHSEMFTSKNGKFYLKAEFQQ